MKEAREALKESKAVQKEIDAKFRDAKKDYNKARFLKSSEKFRDIFVNYPDMDNAVEYYSKIDKKMKYESSDANISNYEDISYAKGFLLYKEGNYFDTISEWQKVLQFNPRRTELEEYMAKAKTCLADVERKTKDKEIEARVSAMLTDGIDRYDAKSWIACIKKMESVQETCRKEPFSKSLEYTTQAKEYISKSLEELAKTVRTKAPQGTTVDVSQPSQSENDLDSAGADKKYKEGLVLYAQGKTGEAINKWEIALRLNPDHERARKAIDRAKEELTPRK
jgi:tetratricopeptide (TPR) repeat protein